MTPRQYGQLLWKVFFKGRSLLKETEGWNKKQILKIVAQAEVYNYPFAFYFVILIGLSLRYLGFKFDFRAAVLGEVMGVAINFVMVALSVAAGMSRGVTVGIVSGILMGVAAGVIFGSVVAGATFGLAHYIALNIALGVAVGVVSGVDKFESAVIILILMAIVMVIRMILGTDIRISLGTLVAYLTVWSRYFYLPVLFFTYRKNISPTKLPFHWDENIGAPLPFLTATLLRISRYDRPAAIAEAIFLIRERPPQRRAAQRALVRIAVEEMLKFRDLRNMTNLKQELAFLPQELTFLPQELNFLSQELLQEPVVLRSLELKVFPDFYQEGYSTLSTFAQDAATALEEHNASNRLRMLQRLANGLQAFRTRMDFTKKDIGIPFGQIAQRWEEIVKKEVQEIEAQSGRPLPNPYVVGAPVKADAEIFMGRRDIIAHIQREALREGGAGAILFVGNRRTGKTSTLLNLKRYLISGLKPVFVDGQDPTITGSTSYFCKTLGNAIRQNLGEAKLASRECSSLAELTEWLKELQEHLQQRQQHVLLCFDEYESFTEKIARGEFADLPNTLRYWVQHLPRVICLFSGAHRLDEAASFDWSNYLINVRTVPISFLDFDSALRLVTAPIPRFELQYEAGSAAAEQFVQRLGCQPYLLQATMSELVNHLNQSNRKIAKPEDIETAIDKMMISASVYFEHIWRSETNEEERGVLMNMAQQSKPALHSERAVRTLLRREVLRLENDGYKFCVPVFGEWILRNG